ncbi:MAG: hypothetical protein EOM19_01435 [Candidatus Moranbacteria bacterium]|nr:hypothetical protein [Candidatus Moranbacteria bacterium]
MIEYSHGKIKDIPRVDRPQEKFLKKDPEVLSKSDLLMILFGSGNARVVPTPVNDLFGGRIKKY